ncbi:MAG: CinA family protein [Gammaproteobacteria bacterium]
MQINQCVQLLATQCLAKGFKIVTAESCTGGWVSHAIVSEAGSSQWFEGGIVSYSNYAKTTWLKVPAELIEKEGAVSEAVASAMAEGALATSVATHAVAITGVAGPGGTEQKPVGLVWFAWGARDGNVKAEQHHLKGDRTSIREQAVLIALNGLQELLRSE